MWKNIVSVLLLLPFVSFGQVYKNDPFDAEYKVLSRRADSLFDEKQYRAAAETFTAAFAANGNSARIDDRFNCACSWAAIGKKDSAFRQLQVVVGGRYKRYAHLLIAPELQGLYEDPRWAAIVEGVKHNRDLAEPRANKELVAKLDTIMIDDQKYRILWMPTEKKYGINSKQMTLLKKAVGERDSINIAKVVAIIERYGWPEPDTAGVEGGRTAFLVIQHADIDIQERYLPMIREQVKKHYLKGEALALLEDRINIDRGRAQEYGTQIGRDKDGNYFVDKLKDPDNVDKRRQEMGMEPMADYVRTWGLKWDVNEYKKQQNK